MNHYIRINGRIGVPNPPGTAGYASYYTSPVSIDIPTSSVQVTETYSASVSVSSTLGYLSMGLGSIDNAASGVIGYVGIYGVNALTNAGTIDGIRLESDNGSITNRAGALITGTAGGFIAGGTVGIYSNNITGHPGPTITNQGMITAGGAGVVLRGGGQLTNGTAPDSAAYIGGGQYGVFLQNTTTMTNFGRINSSGGTGISAITDPQGPTAPGTLTNMASASIAGAIDGVLGGIGKLLSIVNYGTISGGTAGVSNDTYFDNQAGGTVTGGRDGFYTNFFYPATFANYGTIIGTNRSGVNLGDGGSITNGGAGSTEALISGSRYGVLVYRQAGTVTNYASIEATGTAGVGIAMSGASGAGDMVTNGATDSTAAVISAPQAGIEITGSVGTVINFATIAATGGGFGTGSGVSLGAGGSVTNGPSGSTAARISGYQAGVDVTDAAGAVTNYGTIVAAGTGVNGSGVYLGAGGSVSNGSTNATAALISGDVTGVEAIDAVSTVINFGTIVATAATLADSGVYLGTSGTVGNLGTITAPGSKGTGVFLTLSASGGVTNGAPSATSALISGGQSGVTIMGTAGTVVNYATIEGAGGIGVELEAGGSVNNMGGLILGAADGVLLKAGSATVINSGTIAATAGAGVYLEADARVTNLAHQTISGAVNGVVLAVGPDQVYNFGTIKGGANDGVFLKQGGYAKNYAGGLTTGGLNGVEIVATVGGQAARVLNAGTIRGGTGNGSGVYLNVAAGNAVTVVNQQGGTIIGATDGVAITGAYGQLTNYGTVIGTGNIGLYLEFGGYVNNEQDAAIGGGTYGIKALVSSTITNAGTITGGDLGVYLKAGGYVTNSRNLQHGQYYGLIAGGYVGVRLAGAPGTVADSGEIVGSNGIGVEAAAGSYVGNNKSGTISGGVYGILLKPGALGTVANSATIEQTGGSFITYNGSTAIAGVELNGGGTVTNSQGGIITGVDGVGIGGGSGTLANFGKISGGSHDGVFLHNGGTVDNGQGGTAPAPGTITGGVDGVMIIGGAGTVANYNSIAGFGAAGIYLKAAGTVTNAASANGISPLIAGGYYGVLIAGGRGSITNSDRITGYLRFGVDLRGGGNVTNNQGGTITGSSTVSTAGTSTGLGVGVYVAGSAGTVGNAGTILGNGTGTSGIGVYLRAGGGVTNQAGAVIAGQTIGVDVLGGIGTVVNLGTIEGTGTSGIGVVLQAGGTIVDSGTISDAGGTAISFGGTGGNLLVLEPGYQLYGGIAGIAATSDVVDLTGLAFASNTSVAFNAATGMLSVTEGTNSATLQLGGGNYSGISWMATQDSGTGTDITIACFCRGTFILTDKGEVAVEALSIGDRVTTVSGAARLIKWIGRRAYDPRFVAGNPAVLPIRIAAGALADGIPARDLWVSPEHALYIGDVLVPAGLIVNGATIKQVESVERLEYFHLELEAHDVILAEGAPAETYVDCDNRSMFHNAGEFAALYPEDAPTPWQFCAPRVESGSAELTAIRAALWSRAAAHGHALTDDPGLHLIVDGEIAQAQSSADDVYRFTIPSGSQAVWLASRSLVPAEAEPKLQDRRRLGVAVVRIVLHEDALRTEIGPGYASLCEGFHEDEGGHRWTNGMARLPDEMLRPFAGEVTVEVHLIRSSLYYPLEGPTPRLCPERASA